MSKEANINKQKQSILNGFFEADAGLAYPKKGRRDLEIQWIEQYNIEDVDKDIALKALELLGNALYEDPYSDESGDILDILNCKLRILSDYSERYKDSPIWQKMERASIEDLEGDLYVDFSIEHFDEWGNEIRNGLINDNKELIANGIDYVCCIGLWRFVVLHNKQEIVLDESSE